MNQGDSVMADRKSAIDRRDFLKLSAAVAATEGLIPRVDAAENESVKEKVLHRNERPSMTYRKLGRTNFMTSRLVFGCGAALRGGGAIGLLERAFEAGINNFDTGRPYDDSESQLAPFLKKHRDEIWITSKAAHMGWPGKQISPDQGKEAAKLYTDQLDTSLREMQTDYIDCYMLMAIDDVGFVKNEELHEAFLKAKQAGKVGFYGISSHKNTQAVLEAAIETGWYDVFMPGITPAGWFDFQTKKLAEKTPVLKELQSLFQKAREAGIGLIAMKVGWIPSQDSTAFDDQYGQELKDAKLTACQRAYTFVLDHGFDAANSHMPNFEVLEENLQVVRG